jgi:hypothetical protein
VQRQLWELESHAPVLGIPWLSVDLLAVEAAVGAGAEEWMTGGGRGGSCRAGGVGVGLQVPADHPSLEVSWRTGERCGAPVSLPDLVWVSPGQPSSGGRDLSPVHLGLCSQDCGV